MSRYTATFEALKERGEGAFVPFIMLADPSTEESIEIIAAVVEAGADALELGVPFSDPVADGPAIQKAHVRALDGGSTVAKCLEIVREIRSRYPDLPIGMLIYANVAFVRGVESFYREFADAGADSILLPDVPVREGRPFEAAAEAAGIDPIYIAPAKAHPRVLEGVAAHSKGYIYAISRDGVTGTERESSVEGLRDVVTNVQSYGGAPVLLGFGISTPEHVRDAIAAGAAGAISGSAITRIIDSHVVGEHPHPGRVRDMASLTEELASFVSAMKRATIKP
ncbi:tryptophan synthase subunit alpha [Corynebacterium liangguodongii]|uniref:Tryptophan synthase alpha chain n=1 Tax=Corynebacterium liangguodongii TaxID=2079535 RepID=A0A2S0WGN2_9CORY|nr:tryptophan synthase subunit alpha [Corynebacterium liangguodongii]AWB84948.1 tryptophan synthase subunit alpha [Corynebacterium liangguodongii]PWB99344.1 tryptophan synthase subunit alpha [Corynebacterium liangguodongii]